MLFPPFHSYENLYFFLKNPKSSLSRIVPQDIINRPYNLPNLSVLEYL